MGKRKGCKVDASESHTSVNDPTFDAGALRRSVLALPVLNAQTPHNDHLRGDRLSEPAMGMAGGELPPHGFSGRHSPQRADQVGGSPNCLHKAQA